MNGYILNRILKMLLLLLMFIAAIFLVSKCDSGLFTDNGAKETSIHRMVVERIEPMGKLELVKFSVRDVVEEHYDRKWYKGGDTKALVIIAGEAVGCIDLRQLKEEDILEDEDKLVISLPDPEICYVKVDHKRSKVYHVENPPIYDDAPVIDRAYRKAEKQIREAAIETGILIEAKENALKLLTPLLENISGKKVEIVFGYNRPIPQLPEQKIESLD